MSPPPSSPPRRWPVPLPALAAGAVAVVLALVLVVMFVIRGGPGEEEARDVVEDYLVARSADGCEHLRFHSAGMAAEDPSLEDCQEQEDDEAGEYAEFEVTEVRVDGDHARVDVEDHGDAPTGPFTVLLVVEDDKWRVDGIERPE